eukprot:352421-Chlamydomonas_euryale.AAC.10
MGCWGKMLEDGESTNQMKNVGQAASLSLCRRENLPPQVWWTDVRIVWHDHISCSSLEQMHAHSLCKLGCMAYQDVGILQLVQHWTVS